ncbi:hypothetical protein [Microtetraspora glauca]|uniref:SRPBCC family protein n=1 Tax=Microtetraspora glauca TaxID=1996 RepID=A0ABV3GGB0_MICGL
MEQPVARRILAAVLVAVFAAMFLYRVLHQGGLAETALFYVGIPAVIAVSVALTAKPRSVTGLIMVTITICLALAGPLLAEGFVCLVMASPLFYLIGLVMGLTIDWARQHPRHPHALLALPLVLGLSLEGVTDAYSLPRDNEVTVVRQATPGMDIEAALASSPRFPPVESPFLTIGFPKPVTCVGEGLDVGDTRTITFTPRRSLGIGAPLEPRSLTLRVSERGPGRVVFAVTEDTTVARWLDLRETEFRWRDDRITVTMRYRRTFDPGWYFGPLQRYAVSEAGAYLAGAFTS